MAMTLHRSVYKNAACIDDLSHSDNYVVDGDCFSPPDETFIVSRDKLGKPLSRYGDDSWDLRPYRLAGDIGCAKIHFDTLPNNVRQDLKWIIFLILYVADTKRAAGLSVSTIMNYMKVLRQLAIYSDKSNIPIKRIFSNEGLLVGFVKTLNTRNLLRGLSTLMAHLLSLGSDITGIKVLSYSKQTIVEKKLAKLGNDEQHPVIPPRIFGELLRQLDHFLDQVYKELGKLDSFLSNVLIDECFARSESMQRKLGYQSRQFHPLFDEASEIYGLNNIFNDYGVRDIPSLCKFLTRIQHACRVVFHIFSGMRNAEALSLKVGSLKRQNDQSIGTTYRFVGETSKLIGQKKMVSWVTSPEILKAYEIAEVLAKKIGRNLGIATDQTPLFITVSYLQLMSKFKYDHNHFRLNITGSKTQEIYTLLDNAQLKLTVDDLDHLERINPFRAWEAEKTFKIGTVWRFTTHQFRRSLAFYVAQSALVSLPSLKRQLKHIGREMTMYYCQTKELASDYNEDEHIARMIRRCKPEADATAYLYQVLLSDESLYGAHGKFVERNFKQDDSAILLKSSRDALVRRFKKGEIAYKVTHLGACTTIEPCDKKATREIAACISCDRAVIKLSKLKQVVDRQQQFVIELEQINPDSIEFRSEKAELEVLKTFQLKCEAMENVDVNA
jgi:integrase